jgi:hypothetical protein
LHTFAIAILEREREREYIATSSTVTIPKQIQHWGAGRISLLSTFGMCEFVQSCWSHHDRHSNSETQNSCRCVDAAHVHKYSRSKPAHNTTQTLSVWDNKRRRDTSEQNFLPPAGCSSTILKIETRIFAKQQALDQKSGSLQRLIVLIV